MLVLTRKQNQEILIGENVKITVLKMKGNTVRLGIEAPREISVVRGELNREEPIRKPEKPSVAEFTVVFSNSDENQGPTSELIPFRRETDATRGSKKIEDRSQEKPFSDPSRNISAESHKSIQFRGNLPPNLNHNRLKEIVNKLTGSTENTNA